MRAVANCDLPRHWASRQTFYYPEPDSARIAAWVQGKPIWHTLLHEIEFANALAMKVFFKTATAAQATAARGLPVARLQALQIYRTGSECHSLNVKTAGESRLIGPRLLLSSPTLALK